MKSVVIVKTDLKKYRLNTFPKLRDELLFHNIDFQVFHTEQSNYEKKKGDSIETENNWSKKYKSMRVFGGKILIYQIPLMVYFKTDLLILVQSNSNILNFPIILFRKLLGKKTALWGHDKNYQLKKASISTYLAEAYRKFVNNSADFWFSYTKITSENLIMGGYSKGKIQTINNSIPIDETFSEYNNRDRSDIINILFCGSIYEEKNVDYVLQLASKLSSERFKFMIAGDGPSAISLRNQAKFMQLKNVQFIGRVEGKTKSDLFSKSHFTILPGLVGLGILESFYFQSPLLTTRSAFHSPEIAYFDNQKNGLFLSSNLDEAAQELISLVQDKNKIRFLRENCKRSYERYSNENFINNIVKGIRRCLCAS